MSGGGGGSGNDGSNDMQVSGAEAAYSNEPGISTHAESRTGAETNRGGSQDHRTTNYSPDTSTVGIAKVDPFASGEQVFDVNGTPMTKSQMYSTGMIEKDMVDGVQSGEDVLGRYTINPNTGKQERTDMSFSDHWKNAPDAIKFSPTLRFLYASGKNVGEWANKKGFEGYNEAGKRPNDFLGNLSDGSSSNTTSPFNTGGSERDMMNALAPEAPYIVSGITPPTSSPASNWYANLGTTNTNQHATSIATQYAAAKTAVSTTLKNKGAIGMLAVNQSPFYDWLKTNKIDKGIL